MRPRLLPRVSIVVLSAVFPHVPDNRIHIDAARSRRRATPLQVGPQQQTSAQPALKGRTGFGSFISSPLQ